MIRHSHLMGLATLTVLFGLLSAGCGSESGITQPTAGETINLDGDAGIVAIQLQTVGAVGDSSAYNDGHGGGPHNGVALESLLLTFDALRIYPANADSGCMGTGNGNPDRDHDGDCDGDSACGYIEILTDPVTVDLPALGEALTELLGTLDVPTGEYSHLALHIAAAEGTTVDGETVEVTIANRDEMLRIRVPFTIEEGMVTEIAIVIDLSRSVREVPPGSGDFVLVPILHGENWGQHEPGQGSHHGDGHQGEDHAGGNGNHGEGHDGGGDGQGGHGGGEDSGGGGGRPSR